MRRTVIGFLVLVLAVAALAYWLNRGPEVVQTSTFPDVPLAGVQDKALPGSIEDDRGMLLGGLGSGLFSLGHGEYWTITDRGPNGEPSDDVRTFIVPNFTPTLVKVRIEGKDVKPLRYLPLITSKGDPVTGLPPFMGKDDPRSALATGTVSAKLSNPNGLDTEGVVATADGFWVVDEYGPSIARVDTKGHVTARYVPKGTEKRYRGADAKIVGSLPAYLSHRSRTEDSRTSRCCPTARRSWPPCRVRWRVMRSPSPRSSRSSTRPPARSTGCTTTRSTTPTPSTKVTRSRRRT